MQFTATQCCISTMKNDVHSAAFPWLVWTNNFILSRCQWKSAEYVCLNFRQSAEISVFFSVVWRISCVHVLCPLLVSLLFYLCIDGQLVSTFSSLRWTSCFLPFLSITSFSMQPAGTFPKFHWHFSEIPLALFRRSSGTFPKIQTYSPFLCPSGTFLRIMSNLFYIEDYINEKNSVAFDRAAWDIATGDVRLAYSYLFRCILSFASHRLNFILHSLNNFAKINNHQKIAKSSAFRVAPGRWAWSLYFTL